ncbi:response regulator transcription factor [Parabacteroides acidifaciens]|uniref:DNA-binding response regulator n=1 Tax=Parabacteroides acidifaciens TaxID=2290935 RepID=A0A3D8HD43_9BACT|nr:MULTISPECIES: LytTR family DNA-binding domain-containing protein [Parabacteroides]MBC8602396.1 response regulator transcription factor [Parabacteroides acidifaciens]RDU48909.1 DNA-binding response regulator [Parabacteroides acidifaciens]RHO74642.1 DNA-binding response regulator [Parabacteroides sp. AF48-14]RHR55379.1 DNA-binding response regulator [Parabacteroides sp. AF17-28]
MSEEITVVIVDDEIASIRNLSNDLSAYSDIRILETTTSVEKARKIIIRQQPDLLFLDVEMPKMSGFDLWQSIRADVHADMRVIFYTAYDKYVLDALRASAFDYLLKPYLPEELDAVIERFRCVFYRSKVNMEQSMRRLLADDCKFAIQTVTGLLFLKREDVLMFRFSDTYRCWQLYLANRTDYKLRMNISARDLLNMSVSFVQISQNCIVNMDYLCSIENKTLECRLYPPFNDIELVASRRYYGRVKELLEII